MNKINIAFAFDKNYYRQGIIAISSLILKAKENGGDIFYNIYLLINNDVNQSIQKEISKVLISKYDKINIEFINMQNTFKNSYECRGISNACYYRLMLHRILPNLDKIIYSDVDVIFNTDLSEFIDFNIDNYYYCANKDIIYNTKDGRSRVLSKLAYWNNELKDIGKNYRNSGFLILNLKKIREANIDDKIVELSKQKFYFQDQDVLNILFINQQHNIGTISPKYATLAGERQNGLYKIALDEEIISETEYTEITKKPAIIHYGGGKICKPWNGFKSNEAVIWWDFIKSNNLYYQYFQNLKKKRNIVHFAQNLFSIKNEYSNNTKMKVLTILGIKIKFKVNNKAQILAHVERERERESNPSDGL